MCVKKKISLIISIIFIIFMASSLISCELVGRMACDTECNNSYDKCKDDALTKFYQNLITYEKYLILFDSCGYSYDYCRESCKKI